jgi:hypothetical protein
VVAFNQVYQVYVLLFAIPFVHWRPPMPRKKKKKLTELPDEKVIRKLFHKKVADKLREVAHGKDHKSAS